MRTLEVLNGIRKLNRDWNGYNAEPIPKEVCDLVEKVIKQLNHEPEVFPTPDKSIQLQWTNDYTYLECLIGNKIEFLFESDSYYEKQLELKDLDKIKDIVDEFYESPDNFKKWRKA